MKWRIVHRVLSGVLTLIAAFLGLVVASQNTGLGQTTLVWMGIVVAFIPIALTVLPSIFGLSGLKAESETTVVRNAVRNIAPLHPSAARGAPLPIEDPTPPSMA